MAASPPVIVREVWQNNLDYEFDLIQQSIFQFSFASIDTEFPGNIFHPPTDIPKHLYSSLPPHLFYSIMKQNVDVLHLIQLGLTLSDAQDNLPNFSTPFSYAWQFNFRDFDPNLHLHNPDSISLLGRQGIDLSYNKIMGIDSRIFAMKFKAMLLDMRSLQIGRLPVDFTWVTFHGSHDFGFLIKILTGKKLPQNFVDFMLLIETYFGEAIYDLKVMTPSLRLYGGLERITKRLGLDRVAGKSHQAGSDSLLTMQLFVELKKKYLSIYNMASFNCKLYGLTSTVAHDQMK
ncbi:hypothetical protein RD792_016048 [Penstemon davidsonii]|uniref:poly(A)-specific ribonuclease n=1 Tax=Penstemon davidsonii TaxID=160366 RepID=A0ABR0CIA5_9LAMI|nr:hypothetical protein RD792_016048 [Penstemon davidsonii]